MKKRFTAVLLVALITVLAAGCGANTNTANTNSLEKVKKSGKLVIGLDDSFPPMEFRDENNKLVGFDIDLGNEISKKIGVSSEVVTTDFSGIVLALKAKKFDVIISGMSITEERKKEIAFSDAYLNIGQVIAVKNGNTNIKGQNDLKGKVVGCQLGTTGEEAAGKIEGIKELKKYDKVTEAFHDLTAGRIDAVVVDDPVAGYYKQKNGGFTMLDEKLTKEPVGIAFRKEDKELQDAVKKAMDDLKTDGTLSKLSMKWFGFDAYK